MKQFVVLIALVLVFGSEYSHAQELNCRVSLNTSSIQGTNKDVFNTMEEAINDFMNNTVWTNNVFEAVERIECNLMLNLTKEESAGNYKGTLTVQSRRPVYGSSYTTVMLNYIDEDIQFTYTEYDPLEYSETSHLSNLSSILAYYAFIIIGFDYDSFSPMGGTPYFQKADKVVDNAQSTGEAGWKAMQSRERKNRYWLINNIMDESFEPLRQFNYSYHRLGLDALDNSIDRGRLAIQEAILKLEDLYDAKPDPFMHYFQVVMDSKGDEIVQIFSAAPQEEKSRMYILMSKIDPGNINKYSPLQQL